MTVTATARRRRGAARLDKRFKPKMSEEGRPGVNNTSLGKTKKK